MGVSLKKEGKTNPFLYMKINRAETGYITEQLVIKITGCLYITLVETTLKETQQFVCSMAGSTE